MAVTVTTAPADDLTAYAATLNGSLDDMDGNASLDVYFEWGPTDEYGSETTPETLTAIGVFDAAISGLDSHTTYHFRAVATDGVDRWYSADTTLFTDYDDINAAPLNLEGTPGPTSILWTWQDWYFIYVRLVTEVDVVGVPYEYPKYGYRYGLIPDLSVDTIEETPVPSGDDFNISAPSFVLDVPVIAETPATFTEDYQVDAPAFTLNTDIFLNAGTVTISQASPAVVSLASHGLANDTEIIFTTTGALLTPLVQRTSYFVKDQTTNAFNISTSVGGSAIETTGSQSGAHTLWVKS